MINLLNLMMYNLATPFFFNSCQLDSSEEMHSEVGVRGRLPLGLLIVIFLLKTCFNLSITVNERLTHIFSLSGFLVEFLSEQGCVCVACVRVLRSKNQQITASSAQMNELDTKCASRSK